jgi:hypothetical protein
MYALYNSKHAVGFALGCQDAGNVVRIRGHGAVGVGTKKEGLSRTTGVMVWK